MWRRLHAVGAHARPWLTRPELPRPAYYVQYVRTLHQCRCRCDCVVPHVHRVSVWYVQSLADLISQRTRPIHSKVALHAQKESVTRRENDQCRGPVVASQPSGEESPITDFAAPGFCEDIVEPGRAVLWYKQRYKQAQCTIFSYMPGPVWLRRQEPCRERLMSPQWCIQKQGRTSRIGHS